MAHSPPELALVGQYDRAGKLTFPDREKRRLLEEGRRFAGLAVRVTIRRFVPIGPSEAQRGYYRGVVLREFAEHTGASEEELHDDLKREILGFVPDKPPRVLRSTEDLDREEYGRFVDRVIVLAAWSGCVISPPDPNYRWNRLHPGPPEEPPA